MRVLLSTAATGSRADPGMPPERLLRGFPSIDEARQAIEESAWS